VSLNASARPALGLRNVHRLVTQRFQRWWQSRLPVGDKLLLTQRNVYILPTKAGFLFALTLFVLLLATINYQLNLGYVLTFLLAGCGVVSMHLTHGTLRGLNLHLRAPAAVFAGEPAMLETVLSSPDKSTAPRYGIGMKMEAADWYSLAWVDVPAGSQFTARVSFVPPHRGLIGVPALSAETRFPTGLFRAWAVATGRQGDGLPRTRTALSCPACGLVGARRQHPQHEPRWRRSRRHTRLPARRSFENGGVEKSRQGDGSGW
jgi:hypothetical protein